MLKVCPFRQGQPKQDSRARRGPKYAEVTRADPSTSNGDGSDGRFLGLGQKRQVPK